MDENPCSAVMQESEANLVPLYAALALNALMTDDLELAEAWLRRMPRNARGNTRIALEDLSMMLERLGN